MLPPHSVGSLCLLNAQSSQLRVWTPHNRAVSIEFRPILIPFLRHMRISIVHGARGIPLFRTYFPRHYLLAIIIPNHTIRALNTYASLVHVAQVKTACELFLEFCLHHLRARCGPSISPILVRRDQAFQIHAEARINDPNPSGASHRKGFDQPREQGQQVRLARTNQ
jgi:hypothetical protein